MNYLQPFEEFVAPYANVVRSRARYVQDFKSFANTYIDAFRKSLESVREKYRQHRHAFDYLFVNRPFDVSGSGAYRWAKTLERLDSCDPDAVVGKLSGEIFKEL